MRNSQCVVIASASAIAVAEMARHVLSQDAEFRVAAAVAPLDEASACPDEVAVIVAGCGEVDSSIGLISHWRAQRRGCAVVALGLDLQQEHLQRLLSVGADDFILAPFTADELIVRVKRTLGRLSAALPFPPSVGASRLKGLIGSSSSFVKQVSRIPMIAGCDANVLILGETGTGKEICAQAVHYLSARSSRPWVAVNCGAIPTELIENELFGHARGAYTTAHTARAGLVAEAEGGTLFLDEIDCLPVAAQAKLLRFLQEKEFRPVGSNGVVKADVRVIAATNQGIADLVNRGQFRRDLYYRLNVLTLNLPALRERSDDISALALHFLDEFARRNERRVAGIAPLAMQKLSRYEWPGNIRELRHVIERAVLLTANTMLVPEDIELDGDTGPDGAESFQSAKERVVSSFERSYIKQLLQDHHGNISQAARAAKKNRRAFFELIRKHHIEAQRFRSGPPHL